MIKPLLSTTLLLSLLLISAPSGRTGWTEYPTDHLTLEWTVPLPKIHTLNDGTVRVAIEGYEQTAIPGATCLPFTSTLIALPPHVIPSVHILSAIETTIPLPGPLAIAPRPEGTIQGRAGWPIGGAFVAGEPTGQTSILEPVLLEEIGILRGVHLARLTFYPARPEGERLRIVHRLRAEIRWSTAGQAESLSHYTDPLIRQVQQAVLNPWDAIPTWRSPASAALRPAGGGTPTAFIEVSSPGLYRVGSTDVESLGFGWANPQNLRLFQGNQEVAYEWEGDEDTTFESGEAVVFYAEPRFSRWTDVDVYRLVADETPGQRMQTRSADPIGLPASDAWVEQTFEQNRLYTPDRFTPGIPPGRDGDRWVWDYLVGPAPTPAAYPFSLAAPDSTRPATLTLWLIGFTAAGHRWAVQVNGVAIGEAIWTGKTAITTTLSIPPGLLREGDNALSLRPLLNEGAWLDGFAIRYARDQQPAGNTVTFGLASASATGPTPTLPHRLYLPLVERHFTAAGNAYVIALESAAPYRAYDVTDPPHPIRLTGFWVDGQRITLGDPQDGGPRRYFVAAESSVRRPDRIRAREDPWDVRIAGGGFTGADYLIITHPTLANTLGPLVSLRQSQGFTVTVANVLGIYDAYGDGRPDPEAIRAFIAEAYATWNPQPTYVLLVGDGSYDPKRYRPDSPLTFIPPYLADVDPWAGETAADNRYVCVDGEDALPDLLIGRLPVDSPQEAQALVAKIVAYETNPFPGGWNANAILVADDADSGLDFAASADAYAATHVTAPFTVTRRYCAGSSLDASDCSSAETTALHTALLGDWNRGALMVQYTGHSSWQQWAAERFFHLEDLAALHNSRRYPILVEMTCFTGAFQRPEPTLDEQLVTRSGGGAIAAWGPTGLGVSTGHDDLSDGFFRAVFSDTVTTVGEATLAGKLTLASSGQHPELLDTFILLGDPALRFDRAIVPWAAQIFLPLVQR